MVCTAVASRTRHSGGNSDRSPHSCMLCLLASHSTPYEIHAAAPTEMPLCLAASEKMRPISPSGIDPLPPRMSPHWPKPNSRAAEVPSTCGIFPQTARSARLGREPYSCLPSSAPAGDARLRPDAHPAAAPNGASRTPPVKTMELRRSQENRCSDCIRISPGDGQSRRSDQPARGESYER